MLFHTLQFAAAFAALALLLHFCPGAGARKLLLLAFNLFFAWLAWAYAPLFLLVLVPFCYAAAAVPETGGARKLCALAGIALLIASIYLTRNAPGPRLLSFSFVALPLIGFLLDHSFLRKAGVHRPRFFDFAAFATFFPTVMSGPVTRADTIISQLGLGESALQADQLREAVERFSFGLLKKLVIANRFELLCGQLLEAAPASPWLYAVYFYAVLVWVYFDFSGYTDMAIAVALALGVRLPENFLAPFAARSPVDWWRRWHVSLANFLRDYVYYPLFFRVKNLYACVFATFLLNGLWHGAGWNFALLGLYWGCAVSGYILVRAWWDSLLPAWLQIFLTISIAAFSFVFFLPEGTAVFSAGLGALLSRGPGFHTLPSLEHKLLWVPLAGVFLLPLARRLLAKSEGWRHAGALTLLWLFTFFFTLAERDPFFIYSKF